MLAEKLEGKELDTSKIQSLVSDDKTKNLNYEILYKFLESAVEEFILVNHGNPLADDFIWQGYRRPRQELTHDKWALTRPPPNP